MMRDLPDTPFTAVSFNAGLKREVRRDRKVFDNPIVGRQEVFRWCMRYNTRRQHSWCNFLAPNDFLATDVEVVEFKFNV